jgi:SPP1 family phage portal protein
MEELLLQLATEADKVVATIREKSKDNAKIIEFQKEYKDNDRTIRPNQVGNIQKDKTVGTGEKAKLVKAVRIPIKFAKKIVTTATAFEVGKPVTLVASEENNLSKLFSQLWKSNRIDSKITELVRLKKAETQGAIQFYISDLKPESILNKILVKIGLKAQAKDIKSKILNNTDGIMTPYFDSTGNMILFMWEYKAKDSVSGKELNHVEIWDAEKYHYLNDSSGKMAYSIALKGNPLPHGFDRIPIVYVSQEQPEWFDVKEIIDRIEVSLSKLGASNDYSAYPLLKNFGEMNSFPDKDESGKVLQFPMVKDDDGKWTHGNAEFLESSQAVDSVKLELDSLKALIYSISHTPDLSFDNVKGLGTVSGVALKLLFLDAVIKATINEGDNTSMIERIINVMLSGIIKTTNTSLATEAQALYYDINFNSIIPDDVQTASDIIVKLKEAGLLSSQTAIKLLDLVENPVAELDLIKAEAPTPTNPVV